MPITQAVPNGPLHVAESDFRQWVQDNLDAEFAEEALQLYRAEDYEGNWWYAAARLYTYQQYTCPAARSARWAARSGKVSPDGVFLYELDFATAAFHHSGKSTYYKYYCLPKLNQSHLNHFLFPCPERGVDIGVAHEADNWMLFPDPKKIKSATDIAMTKAMLGWWQSFAAAMNPTIPTPQSEPEALQWRPYVTANETLELAPNAPGAVANNRAKFCEFWDRQHPMPYNSARRDGRSFVV